MEWMVIAGAVLWGTYGSFVTLISRSGISSNVMVFLRFLATAGFALAMILTKDRKQFSVHKKDIPLFIANGICSIWFFSACYTAAIIETKIATAAALLYTAPAFVLIFSVMLFGEKLSFRKVICILLSVLGCALVSGVAGGVSLTARGFLLGMGAGLGYALYSIFSRIIMDRGYSSYTNILYTFLTASACYLILSCREGSIGQIITKPSASLLCLVCGLLTGALAYVLYTNGLQGMEASKASQLATIEPVTAAILGACLFHQTLSVSELGGVVLVVGSVILMNVRSS